jgi:NAD(P)-dependent dehydrogenase (short-subunit alcohol dehydrogenase family)
MNGRQCNRVPAKLCGKGLRSKNAQKQFAVNHLGHFILINQRLKSILASTQGRFTLLSSRAHGRVEQGIEFDNLDGSKHYGPWDAYGVSKLANALCARELATRISHTEATSNSVQPGVIATGLLKNLSVWEQGGAKYLAWAFLKTIPEGAATTCYVATGPELIDVRGFYFADCNVEKDVSPYLEDDVMAAKLWKVSEALREDYLSDNQEA